MSVLRTFAPGIVKASAAFTPASLPTLAFWFDGALGVTDAGGGAVSQWADQSGNANHLTQATAGLRPTTGTRTINGINAIDFDGTESLVMGNAGGITTVAYMWIVMIVDAVTGLDYVVHAGGGNGEFGFHYRLPGEGDVSLAINNNAATRATVGFNNLWLFGATVLHRFRFDGTTIMGVKVSGQAEVTAVPAVPCATPENIRLMAIDGTADFADGAVVSFGATTSDLTGTQGLTDLLAYLNSRFGVAA